LRLCFFFMVLCTGAVSPPSPSPPLLQSFDEKTVQLKEKALAREKELARSNRRALERLAAEAARRRDPALRLWTYRELRLHKDFPFSNLHRPDTLTGYPEALRKLSEDLREELTAFLNNLQNERNGLVDRADHAFDARIRTLVRADRIDEAEREQEDYLSYPAREPLKNLNNEISRIEDLLSGKTHQALWKRSHDEGVPAPPDALILFEPDNPAFLEFKKSVTAVSRGSPNRGVSGVNIGGAITMRGRRGLSVLALEGAEVILRGHYDTYASRAEALRLVEDIQSLPYGAFVVVVAHDDATRRFAGESQSTLFRLGAARGLANLPYRSAYLLIGVKGMRPGGAVELSHKASVKYPSDLRENSGE